MPHRGQKPAGVEAAAPRANARGPRDGGARPRVSLVIPLRNEEATLARLLESVRRQTFPPAEIVLVDGGSTDATVALARAAAAADARIRVVEAGDATPGRGRNIGVAAASSDWIAFTDAGIVLEPTWLELLIGAVTGDPPADVAFGNYEVLAASFFERCAALAYVSRKVERPGGPVRGPVVPSSLMRRQVWEAVGGFPDLRAAEDMIFVERVMASGYAVGWAPGATVWWQLPPTLGGTFRRFLLYSRHNVWAGRQRDWHYGTARQYALALPLAALAAAHSPWWLLPVALGLAARVFKSVWVRREGRGLLWAINPVQFACVGLIILVIDLATFVGWAQAVRRRPPRGQVVAGQRPVA
jgi:glycosyltransferase involved in cell wall biosynthesis